MTLPRTAHILTRHCPGQRIFWHGTAQDSAYFDTALPRTAHSLTRHCPGQRIVWHGTAQDSAKFDFTVQTAPSLISINLLFKSYFTVQYRTWLSYSSLLTYSLFYLFFWLQIKVSAEKVDHNYFHNMSVHFKYTIYIVHCTIVYFLDKS